MVGKSFTFQLKLKDFNFTAHHQTFTISRVFAAPEIAPIPNFAVSSFRIPISKRAGLRNIKSHALFFCFQEAGEVPPPAVPQTVAPGAGAVGAVKSNVAGDGITSDGPLGGRETAEEEQVDLQESAPKKARVE